MSHWNHRVMRHSPQHFGESDYLQIHEVYYAEDGTVKGWTENPVTPGQPEDGYGSGKTGIECLRWELEMMLKALDKPVLDYEMEPGSVREEAEARPGKTVEDGGD